jgi:hypothetical protein
LRRCFGADCAQTRNNQLVIVRRAISKILPRPPFITS